MSNFHGRLINIQPPQTESSRLSGYYEGHRDARHAAAEIGIEADAIAAKLAEAERDAARYRESCDVAWKAYYTLRQEVAKDRYPELTNFVRASETVDGGEK